MAGAAVTAGPALAVRGGGVTYTTRGDPVTAGFGVPLGAWVVAGDDDAAGVVLGAALGAALDTARGDGFTVGSELARASGNADGDVFATRTGVVEGAGARVNWA